MKQDKTRQITNNKIDHNQVEDLHTLDIDTKEMLLKIQEEINILRKKGISEAIIARYVRPYPKISRMTITNDFRIILNEYKDMEITMEPLVKTAYVLFLRHPKGILFKNLPDYKREVETIYRCIKAKRNDVDRQLNSPVVPKISQSIELLCDPTNNSINEKCTRIKKVFITRFNDSIAKNYYIQGGKETKKRITLPRDLIIWEGEYV